MVVFFDITTSEISYVEGNAKGALMDSGAYDDNAMLRRKGKMGIRQTVSKNLIVLAMLSLAACSNGDDNNNPPPVNGAVLNVGVLDGIVVNGQVDVFPINSDGTVGPSIAQATTGIDGKCALSGYDGPVEIKMTVVQGTYMPCDISDAAGGCPANGDNPQAVAFGGKYYLHQGDTLSALVPDASSDLRANISPMSNMAAAMAKSDPEGLTAAVISTSNSQVANFFALTDLLDYTPVDLANSTAVASASGADINIALLSSVMGDPATAIDPTTGLLTNGVKAIVYDKMGTLLNGIISKNPGVATLTTLRPQLANLHNIFANLPADDVTDVGSSPNATKSALDKTKAFVSDIRNIVYSTTQSNGTLMLGAQDFASQLNIAAQASSLDTQGVMNATNYSVQAMGLAIINDVPDMGAETQIDTFIESVTAYTWLNGELTQQTVHIPVAVTKTTGGGYTLTVNGSVLDATVDISAALSADAYAIVQAVAAGNMEFSRTGATLGVSGTVTSGNAELSVAEGSTATVDVEWTITNPPLAASLTISSVALNLEGSLKQLSSDTITNPVTFTGKMNFDATNIVADATTTSTESGDLLSATGAFDSATLTLTGTFADTQGSSFGASLVVVADGTGYAFTDLASAANFNNFGFTLTFNVTLPGLSQNASLQITGGRDTLMTGSGTVTVSYEGKRFVAVTAVDAETGDISTVTITNQDNVKMVVNVTNNSGIISVAGTQYATVENIVGTGIKVSFSDGSFTIN